MTTAVLTQQHDSQHACTHACTRAHTHTHTHSASCLASPGPRVSLQTLGKGRDLTSPKPEGRTNHGCDLDYPTAEVCVFVPQDIPTLSFSFPPVSLLWEGELRQSLYDNSALVYSFISLPSALECPENLLLYNSVSALGNGISLIRRFMSTVASPLFSGGENPLAANAT
ncbi:hypothetical protein PoB_005540700 [Plakobranchus ocellatus]|uniref:Uncharacterized protein n=1 Tax=Plakobranchus ocellatus TaxID=259542 RepID=A0AAV4CBI3_9GAST|nr:hypothetical protein PoB_005540700 [Plakobranchus ocellatus]